MSIPDRSSHAPKSSSHHIEVHQERQFSSGMLSINTTYRLLVTGDCDLKELDRLIRILTVQKQILEEADAETSHSPEAPAGQDEDHKSGEIQHSAQVEGGANGERPIEATVGDMTNAA